MRLGEEEHRGAQLAAQLETALTRVAALEHKLKQAAEKDAASAASRAAQDKAAFDANIAAGSLSKHFFFFFFFTSHVFTRRLHSSKSFKSRSPAGVKQTRILSYVLFS